MATWVLITVVVVEAVVIAWLLTVLYAESVAEQPENGRRHSVLHVPKGGCPAGYHLVADIFEMNGQKYSACVCRDGDGSIDYLLPGEAVRMELLLPKTIRGEDLWQ